MIGIIYKAENKVNGKIYIGKTIQPLCRRKAHHNDCAKKNKYNSHFHRAIRKYGIKNFNWFILTYCDSENKLSLLEKFYIACYKKTNIVYNNTDGGDGSSGHKHSIESRKKMSIASKNRVAPSGMSHYLFGKNHTDETKLKISESEKGKTLSEKHKEILRVRMTGVNNPMYGKKRPDLSARNKARAKMKCS